MTVDAFSFALDDCPDVTSSRDAFLLVALGNNSDAYGLCYPRQSTLMEKTRMKVRAVREGLKSLEDMGMILRLPRRRRDGSRKSDAYLLMGWPLKRENRRRGRMALTESDGHPLLAELGLTVDELNALVVTRAAELSEAAGTEQGENTNRQQMPPAPTGSKCRDNRHLTPDQPAANAGIEAEPSLEPSEEPKPPTPLEGGREGFDLFVSVFPMARSTNVNLASARSDWRKAVDALGPDAVLGAARVYADRVAKTGQLPCGIRKFLNLSPTKGLIRQHVPAEAVKVGPVELGTTPQHEFLKAARAAGVDERHIRHWARPGAFVVVAHDHGAANKAIGVDGDVMEFKAAFLPIAEANRMVVWPLGFLRRREAKAQSETRRAG